MAKDKQGPTTKQQLGLDDLSETIGNSVVPETPMGSSNVPAANDEDEIMSPTGPNVQGIPAYLAWLKQGVQFEFDPIYQKEDIELVKFDNVDPNAQHLVPDTKDIVHISCGWGKCLLGRFAGRFPGKEGVYGLMHRHELHSTRRYGYASNLGARKTWRKQGRKAPSMCLEHHSSFKTCPNNLIWTWSQKLKSRCGYVLWTCHLTFGTFRRSVRSPHILERHSPQTSKH